jgi:hypothetical protein
MADYWRKPKLRFAAIELPIVALLYEGITPDATPGVSVCQINSFPKSCGHGVMMAAHGVACYNAERLPSFNLVGPLALDRPSLVRNAGCADLAAPSFR